ncbi:MAG: hypothetical protein R3C59_02610 [Planctomycetaceae bacterium]
MRNAHSTLAAAFRHSIRTVVLLVVTCEAVYEINAYFDGDAVWHKPRSLVFDHPTFTHFAGQYPRTSLDVSLDGAFEEKTPE